MVTSQAEGRNPKRLVPAGGGEVLFGLVEGRSWAEGNTRLGGWGTICEGKHLP
jgi:hypothetical protein